MNSKEHNPSINPQDTHDDVDLFWLVIDRNWNRSWCEKMHGAVGVFLKSSHFFVLYRGFPSARLYAHLHIRLSCLCVRAARLCDRTKFTVYTPSTGSASPPGANEAGSGCIVLFSPAPRVNLAQAAVRYLQRSKTNRKSVQQHNVFHTHSNDSVCTVCLSKSVRFTLTMPVFNILADSSSFGPQVSFLFSIYF